MNPCVGAMWTVLLGLTGMLLVGCGGGGSGLANAIPFEEVVGTYQTIHHSVNAQSCSQSGTPFIETTTVDGAGTFSHFDYFRIVQDDFFDDRVELETCETFQAEGCMYGLFHFYDQQGQWTADVGQAGDYSGPGDYDCEIVKRAYRALPQDDGTLRLEYRLYQKRLKGAEATDSGPGSLDRAYALSSEEACEFVEVIIGKPVY